MNLREWLSNDKKLMEFVDTKDHAKTPFAKVLGINWDSDRELISLNKPKSADERVTKRSVWETIASSTL